MKNITELSEQEILKLTNEELELMVKLAMAQQGYKIIPMPEMPVYEPIPQPNITGYSVKGCDFIFTDIAEAQKVSALIKEILPAAHKSNYHSSNYDYKVLTKNDGQDYTFKNGGEITSNEYFSREVFNTIDSAILSNKNAKSEYENLLKEYNESYNASAEIRDSIYAEYNRVTSKYNNFNRLKNHYAEYLLLSGGDKIIAMNFLKKAYEVDEEAELFINPKKQKDPIPA